MRKSARPSPAEQTGGQRTNLLDSLLRIAGVYTAYEKWLTQQVKGRPLPEHIGIILDGNRRWAEENALRPNDGHIIGAKVGEEVLDWCLEYGIKTLTLYTFSTENFDRPAEEVNAVLKLVEEEARKLGRDNRLHTQKVRVKALGRTDLLPESLQDALKKLEDDTSAYTGHFLNIAIAYTGRAEIVDATKKIVEDVYQGNLRPQDIDEGIFLKRIDIRGFKTFNKKVSINLSTGFTVITGPNGSGKSNILDSLKFALGELSPRELRGRSLSDLVHKSQGEGARSAYVAVQFDNTDRKLPVDSDLVTISREFSKGGEGIYRLNGRRLSRKQVQDIMSSADIQVTGFNLISQHAITRLAEISTEERRRILESLIGIGTFETKKAEARVQLSEADLNLKVASARVDEVRQRIEQLERERNDLLRSNLLKTEINSQQARILSAQILSLETRHQEMLQTLDQEQLKLDQVRHEREDLTQQRAKIEEERRRFEEKTVTQGNQELFDLERRIAEASKGIVEAKSTAETAKNLVATRTRQRDAFTKQAEDMEISIKPLASSIKNLQSHKKTLEDKMDESTSKVEKISQKLTAARASLDQDNKKLREVQDEIDGLGRELSNLTAQSKGSSTKLDLTASHLQTLEARQQEFAQLSEELKSRIREMEKLQKEEEKRLETIEQKTKDYGELKDQRRKEIDEALEIAKRARVTVVEFNTQKNLADSLGAEDRAIEKIEEMADEGALNGVYGRLEDLVKFPEEYGKAIQAASAGWMKALVVKNLEVAIKCIESLKRTKLGRVKIVPIDDLELPNDALDANQAPGIIGPLSKVIRSDRLASSASFESSR